MHILLLGVAAVALALIGLGLSVGNLLEALGTVDVSDRPVIAAVMGQ
jgi:hypothetical protein